MAQRKRYALRLGLLAATALVSLIGATQAFAAITPHLLVTSSGSAHTLNISASKPQSDDPVARIQIDVPTGYTLNSPAPGAKVGSVSAQVVARDIDATTEQSMTGSIAAISPTDTSVAFDTTNCDNKTHLAAWSALLTGTNGQLNVPIFIDEATGTDATFGKYVMVVCFRPVVAAAGQNGANRSPNGDTLDTLNLSLTPFVSPTKTATYRWRSLWTPYTSDFTSLNTAGNAEAQSVVSVPGGVISITSKTKTVKVKGKTQIKVTLSGKLEVGGEVRTGTTVSIRSGLTTKKLSGIGTVRTSSSGTFLKRLTLGKSTYFQATAALGVKDLGSGGCQASFGTTVPCVDATIGGSTALSRTLHVKG